MMMDIAHGDAGGLVWSGRCEWEDEMHCSSLATYSRFDFSSRALDMHGC
jgi:hypothetical protein